MPIYEYKCTRCEQTFEVMQSFSEVPLGTHPGCGGDVRRVISAPGIIFKGSGFYVTDSRKEKDKSAPSTSKKSDASAKSSEAVTKTDSTTKTESAPSKPSTKPSTESSDSKK